MPRPRTYDLHAIDDLARAQGGVITHGQLVSLGMSSSSISRWTRTGGRWQRLLPATYLVHRGTPTFLERMHAATQYGGPGALQTGLGALHLYGLHNLPCAPQDLPLHVLLHRERQLRSASFLTVERTQRMPEPMSVNGFAVVPLPRAIFDAGRRTADRRQIRAFTLEAVQRKLLDVDDLRSEIRNGQRQWTALMRDVVGDAAAGVRSVPEAGLRDIVRASHLPEPEWNPTLTTMQDEFIAEPDGYYEDLGIALEVDSRKHHFDDEDGYDTTWSRHRRFAELSIAVLRITPVDIRDSPAQVIDSIERTRAAHSGRQPPPVKVSPKGAEGRRRAS
jgi:hypothetical protein